MYVYKRFFFALKKYILKSVNNILPVKKKARFHFTLKYIFKGNATHVSIFTRSCCKLNNKIINKIRSSYEVMGSHEPFL